MQAVVLSVSECLVLWMKFSNKLHAAIAKQSTRFEQKLHWYLQLNKQTR